MFEISQTKMDIYIYNTLKILFSLFETKKIKMKFLLFLTLALIASKYNFIFTIKSRKMHFIFAL